ncbi:transcriptional regulator [Egibacter rhizosphaerae]|uniref:Transcriptional regulator n=1 Tax=Egibacter rhizosphaerae TaxID=1670831 RepID=A0A411YGC5_9ACTN|nr:transcriptional regulator [Egibacter rhizosphaerae]QBI20229.1 transcriptional regulator [Egibacter rhizosphaerae]
MAAQETTRVEPTEARDAMAFGQETGRVLSDGRIVGRAEPFAKVFASSREVKRAVGLAAWCVLEDIALDAVIDQHGRLVSETNVRRIGENLGLNKDTVSKHLRRLREYGFVFQEEYRDPARGRWEVCRYVLDPSACVERFTHTPSGSGEPCPKDSDTGEREPVSEFTGHGDFGHLYRHVDVVTEQQQQPPEREPAAVDWLRDLGVSAAVAADLAGRHDQQRISDVVTAAKVQQLRTPAGWPLPVRFAAANTGHPASGDPGRLARYLDPEHERALASRAEADRAARQRRRADEDRRRAVGCRTVAALGGRSGACWCVYCDPAIHLNERRQRAGWTEGRCVCGALPPHGSACVGHRCHELVVLVGDHPAVALLLDEDRVAWLTGARCPSSAAGCERSRCDCRPRGRHSRDRARGHPPRRRPRAHRPAHRRRARRAPVLLLRLPLGLGSHRELPARWK